MVKKTAKRATVNKRASQMAKADKASKSLPTKKVAAPQPTKLAIRRGRITPPPPYDVAELLPAVASLGRTTVRLHPQRAKVPNVAASKLGGEFLWPRDEPWPVCDAPIHEENARPVFVPILQLRKDDVPELGFPSNHDLFQLLWCPSDEHETYYPQPLVFWRTLAEITDAVLIPQPTYGDEDFLPLPCRLTPERVIEYPPPGEVKDEVLAPLSSASDGKADLHGVYQFQLSACPGTKVGGYPAWMQDAVPVCCSQGHDMEFLLQLGDSEYCNTDEHPRWIPQADRWVIKSTRSPKKEWERVNAVFNPPDFRLNHTVYYFFICRKCVSLPVTLYTQRA